MRAIVITALAASALGCIEQRESPTEDPADGAIFDAAIDGSVPDARLVDATPRDARPRDATRDANPPPRDRGPILDSDPEPEQVDFGEPIDAAPRPDAEGIPTCESECGRLTACSVQLCDGITVETADAFYDGCLETCADNPALVALASSQPECPGLVQTLSAVSPDYADACNGEPPPPPPPPPPGDDTAPLNEFEGWGPAARITFFDVPPDPASAEASGCTVVGARRGSGLAGLFGLLGEAPSDFYQPDDAGRIRIPFFFALDGWQPGETGNEAGEVELQLLAAEQVGGGFRIARSAFEGNAPDRPVRSRMNASLQGEAIAARGGSIRFPLMPLTDPVIELTLENTRFQSALRVSADGFDTRNGVLEGILTRDALADFMEATYVRCEAMRDDICEQLMGIAPTAEDATVLFDALLGYDVRWENGRAAACDADCNATGVCALIELTGTPLAAP